MKVFQLAVAIGFVSSLGAPAWADSYDGAWDVVGAAQSNQCPGYNMKLDVKGSSVTGTTGTVKFTYRVNAKLAPDGTFAGQSPGGTAHVTGKFAGDTVTVQFWNDLCPSPRTGTGKKSG